jgi:SagB-type dehydrogenase family enzyme
LILIAIFIFLTFFSFTNKDNKILAIIKLPAPIYHSNTSIEQALKERRSIRTYGNGPITLQQVAQLLWAAQGITSVNGFRTSPSAGGLYPLDIYVICGNINTLPTGVYHYNPKNHSLKLLVKGDKRKNLAIAALNQTTIQNGNADIVITGTYMKTIEKYGQRGKRYVYMEAGHVAENIYLQAVSLGIGTVSIGAFNDTAVKSILNISNNTDPLYIMPIGKIK